MLESLVLFILCCYGLTSILVYGKIFNKIRPKYGFFHCTMCMGFHVGWIIYILFYYSNFFSSLDFINLFIFSCISSGTSYLMSNLVDDEGIRIK
jgi:hypothetical protein